MHTRREFLIGCGASLILAAGGAQAAGKQDARSPVTAVRAFLAARARHDSRAQYALLSVRSQESNPFNQFDTEFAEDKTALAHASESGVSPLLAALSVFFMDARAVSGYTFSVIGADPDDRHAVLVRALPPGAAAKKAFLLKIVTAADLPSGPSRLELLPSYQKTNPADYVVMRDYARGVASLSNLRQIGLALTLYADAHEGRLPPAESWIDALIPIWKDNDPSFPAENLFRDPLAPEGQPWNYAFNSSLSGMRISDIKDPASTVLVFESTKGIKNASDSGQSVPHPGRYHGGSYYAFADGHAKWLPDGTALSYTADGK